MCIYSSSLCLSFPKDLLHPKIPWDLGDGATLGSLGGCFARVGEGFTFSMPLFWQGIDAPLQNALKAAGVTCCVRAVEPRYSFTYTGHLNLAGKKAAFVVCQWVETPARG